MGVTINTANEFLFGFTVRSYRNELCYVLSTRHSFGIEMPLLAVSGSGQGTSESLNKLAVIDPSWILLVLTDVMILAGNPGILIPGYLNKEGYRNGVLSR